MNFVFIPFLVQNGLLALILRSCNNSGTYLLKRESRPAVKPKDVHPTIRTNRLGYLTGLKFGDCCLDVRGNIRVANDEFA